MNYSSGEIKTVDFKDNNGYLHTRLETDAERTLTWADSTETDIFDGYKSSMDELYERIMAELSYKPMMQHKCNNCGAPIKLEADNHIFKCGYCGTAYLIGTNHING